MNIQKSTEFSDNIVEIAGNMLDQVEPTLKK